jgi:D-tyrosyl-tRNA(Tyr) deacylase
VVPPAFEPAIGGISVDLDSTCSEAPVVRFLRRVESPRMKCVIQRVRRASVTVDGELVSEIGAGLLVLAAVEKDDPESRIQEAAKKVRELRIFSDDAGKMNRDVGEAGGAILAVSQFTLAGSLARGRRPSFDNAEEPGRARELFELFVRELASTGIEVKTGRFREMMVVSLENDGPVTFVWP